MERGNEGDEIVLFSLRQIGCPIGDSVASVGQLNPDLIVEIVSRCLDLISDGEIKFPLALPANIATRHRVCTDMAQKVKDLGFSGDCGYNQLLYPVETQTKSLLTWLVQRLPRTEEEGAEEVLGANAMLNKRIMESLVSWKSSTWRLPCCATGVPLRNIYGTKPFRTVSLEKGEKCRNLFSKAKTSDRFIDPSLLEKHALEVLRDSTIASRLEDNFEELDVDKETKSKNKESSERMQAFLKNVISAAQMDYTSSKYNPGGRGGTGLPNSAGGRSGGAGNRENRQADMLSQSLPELIQSIAGSSVHQSSAGDDKGRGTRFMHAAEFAQEVTATIGGGAGGGGGGGGSRGRPMGSTAAARQAALAAATADLDAEDAEVRRSRQEEEQRAREKEIDDLRAEVLAKQAALEAHERNEQNMSSKARQLESELSALLAQSEALEKEIMLKRKTLEMLPMAAENIGKLQTICGASSKRLVTLAQEWETHRRPLVEKLRQKHRKKAVRRNKCRMMVEEIKRQREEMANMIQDLKDKQERIQLLLDEQQKLPKNINRAMYTHRIMDIIASIAKQNVEIDKITTDIHGIQKTINATTNSLQRADAVAEELVYAAANGVSSDKAMVDTYRRLRQLRARFDDLVSTASRIGVQEKLQRDLETKIDQETSRVSAANMERIRTDLQQVVAENAQLVAQIKAKSR